MMKEGNATCQMFSNEWQYQKSMKIKTEKKHFQAIEQDPASQAHPLFSMGGRKHYEERLSNSYQFKPHMKKVDVPEKPEWDKQMAKIIENYPILKPKVERIGGQDDFNQMVGGNTIL